MNNKLRSFTLVEVTVALVVSAVVVTILFKFFFFLSSYRYQRSFSSESLTEIVIAKKALLNSLEDEALLDKVKQNTKVEIINEELETPDLYRRSYYLEKGDFLDTLSVYKKKSELERLSEKTKNGTKY